MFVPPDQHTPLSTYPWVVIRFRCHWCKREGDSRLALCAQRYGAHATLAMLLDVFVSRCPYDPHNQVRKPQKYSHRCGAYLPDVGRSGPPDLPPVMTGLSVIEGGKDEMAPAEPGRQRRRRRGGEKESGND